MKEKNFLADSVERIGKHKSKMKSKSFRNQVIFCTLKSVFIFSLFLPLCGFKFVSELQNEKGNSLYKKGQVGRAKTEYTQALKTDPSSSKVFYNLGNALFKEGAFKDSQAAYQKASGEKGQESVFQAKAYYNLGNSLYRLKDLPNAAEAYKKSLRLNPKDEDAKYNLELILKQLEKEKKEDPKKDQEKKEDQKKDEQKKNDPKKNESGGGGGSQGTEDPQPQEPKDEEGENKPDQGGRGQGSSGDNGKEQEKPSEEIGEKNEPSEEPGKEKEGEGKPEEGEGQEDSGEKNEPGEEEEGEGKPGVAEGQEEGGGSTGQEAQEQPKTEAQIRAEQILGALENQERQVLKFQNGQDGPKGRVRRVSEQDW